MNYVKILVAVGLLALLSYLSYDYGVSSTTVEWQGRENKELSGKNQKIIELNAQIREAEKTHNAEVAALSTHYQKEIRNANAKVRKLVASINSGDLRLFDAAARQGSNRSASGAPGSASGRSHGKEAGELSRESSEFLLGLAGECDEITIQLTECQEIILADRRLCK